MAEASGGPTGFYRSVRQLGAGIFAAFQERFELICVEVQEEKLRIVHALILINVAIACGFLALIFITITIVFAFPRPARLIVLACVSAIYAGASAAAILAMLRMLRRQREILPATRRALSSDRSCTPPPN
ncbi:MAG: phage holin family protein [Opitutaceae bacterium]